jgi:hypothetical protein
VATETASSIRPFAWCFEKPLAVNRAIAYPHHWRRAEYADLYGFGDNWRDGEPLSSRLKRCHLIGERGQLRRARSRVEIPALADGIEERRGHRG